MDLKSCLVCLKMKNGLISIFSEYGISQKIKKTLTTHFWFEIKEDDNYYSNKICQECWNRVESFHLFYTQVFDSHNNFYSDKQNFKKPGILEEAIPELIKNEVTATEQKRSEHLLKSNKLTNNDELNKINDVKDNADVSNSENDNDAIDSAVSDSSEDKYQNSKSSFIKRTSKLNTRSSKKSGKTIEQLDLIEKEDQKLREYFEMGCELCSSQFHVFQNVKSHYRIVHKLNGYLTCCDKKFFKRCHALEHIRRHLNPNAFKCDICDKVYIDKRGLQTHMYQHLPSEEKPFKCDKCPKAFAKNSLLRQHQISHVTEEDKSFFCDKCGKAFASNRLLQFHKRGVHEGAFIHVCEICAKSFKSKLFFENHMKVIHSDDVLPRVQCQTCGAWLKHENSLKRHMQRHEDANKTYICNICGKHAPNQGALQSHKKYAHLIERNHKCTTCNKAFKKPVTLREHMTLHTNEILYKCPHCPKTFNSSANLHSHRKKLHTKEWEQTRRTKIINYKEKVSTIYNI